MFSCSVTWFLITRGFYAFALPNPLQKSRAFLAASHRPHSIFVKPPNNQPALHASMHAVCSLSAVIIKITASDVLFRYLSYMQFSRCVNLSWRPPAFPYRLQHSIIGRPGLNYRVRDGYGCYPWAHQHQQSLSPSMTQQ